MKTSLVLSLLALTASVGVATAADLGRRPAPAPVVPLPPAYNWSGFYFGGHLGAGWGDTNGTTLSVSGAGGLATGSSVSGSSEAGFIGGLQGGYNFALSPNWMLGVEGDITWTDISQTQTNGLVSAGGVTLPNTSLYVQRDLNWLASVRGRLGYTWDRWMIYGTGGAAWADYDATGTATLATGAVAGGSISNKTRSGWVVGGGVEWAIPSFWLGGDWTARVEYLHYEFDGDTRSASFSPGPGTATFTVGDPTVDVVRVGLNYKFNWR